MLLLEVARSTVNLKRTMAPRIALMGTNYQEVARTLFFIHRVKATLLTKH